VEVTLSICFKKTSALAAGGGGCGLGPGLGPGLAGGGCGLGPGLMGGGCGLGQGLGQGLVPGLEQGLAGCPLPAGPNPNRTEGVNFCEMKMYRARSSDPGSCNSGETSHFSVL
jgi:hypothetical protein